MQISKQNMHGTFDPRNNLTPVHPVLLELLPLGQVFTPRQCLRVTRHHFLLPCSLWFGFGGQFQRSENVLYIWGLLKFIRWTQSIRPISEDLDMLSQWSRLTVRNGPEASEPHKLKLCECLSRNTVERQLKVMYVWRNSLLLLLLWLLLMVDDVRWTQSKRRLESH